jgi:hypothetical protein
MEKLGSSAAAQQQHSSSSSEISHFWLCAFVPFCLSAFSTRLARLKGRKGGRECGRRACGRSRGVSWHATNKPQCLFLASPRSRYSPPVASRSCGRGWARRGPDTGYRLCLACIALASQVALAQIRPTMRTGVNGCIVESPIPHLPSPPRLHSAFTAKPNVRTCAARWMLGRPGQPSDVFALSAASNAWALFSPHGLLLLHRSLPCINQSIHQSAKAWSPCSRGAGVIKLVPRESRARNVQFSLRSPTPSSNSPVLPQPLLSSRIDRPNILWPATLTPRMRDVHWEK